MNTNAPTNPTVVKGSKPLGRKGTVRPRDKPWYRIPGDAGAATAARMAAAAAARDAMKGGRRRRGTRRNRKTRDTRRR
jgi:hypothetical protein